MKFRTILKQASSPIDINYQSKVLFMGSCFAQNIGKAMGDRKFMTSINPLGISYNPISLAKNIATITECKSPDPEEVYSNESIHFHYDFHGINNALSRTSFVEKIDDKIKAGYEFVKTTDILFISLGTAHVFSHKDHGVVNNCHKMPNDLFTRRLLKVEEIVSALQRIITQLTTVNYGVKIVFTVSPIRHIRDGLVADRRSKSMLIAALTQVINDQDVFYFPSYELLIDDLRDYRFYKADMIHPNDQAIGYIWEYFSESYFSTDTIELIRKVDKINSMLSHRQISHSTDQARILKEKIKTAVSQLTNHIPEEKWQLE